MPPATGAGTRAADTVRRPSGPRTLIGGTPPILTSPRATRPGVDVSPMPMRVTADEPTTTKVGGASESGGTTTAYASAGVVLRPIHSAPCVAPFSQRAVAGPAGHRTSSSRTGVVTALTRPTQTIDTAVSTPWQVCAHHRTSSENVAAGRSAGRPVHPDGGGDDRPTPGTGCTPSAATRPVNWTRPWR